MQSARTPPMTGVESRYREEMQATLLRRLPLAGALFIVFMGLGSVLEFLHYPQRLAPLAGVWLVHLGIWAAALLICRRRPEWTLPTVLAAANLLALSICGYYAAAEATGELGAFTLILLLTGFVLLNPWGWWGQLVASIGAVVGYPLALGLGAVTASPPAFGIAALLAGASLTTVGAHLIDEVRYEAFRNAAEAERAQAATSELVGALSHEIRTPFNGIVGYTDMLLEGAFGPLSPPQLEPVQRLRHLSGLALDLIQGILDLHRMDSGVLTLSLEELRLEPLMENVAATIPVGWMRPGVTIDWDVKAPRTLLRTDRRKLELVLRNLVHNALKHTEEGSVTVSARPQFDTGRLTLTVRDTGSGIPRHELTEIFEMFRQSSSASHDRDGVGLGLFIVKRFTDALGGEITVTSDPGTGSEFTVSVPLRAG